MLLVVKQNPGNQTIFARKALTDDFHKDGCNIKTFCDSIPKAIMVKELNQYSDNRNAQLWSISRATTNQLLHYLGINIDSNTETILIYVVANDILNSDANMSWLLLNMKNMFNMVGIRHIFVSGLVYTKRSKIGVPKEVHKKLVYLADDWNFSGFNIFKGGLHLLELGKRLLTNSFIANFDIFCR